MPLEGVPPIKKEGKGIPGKKWFSVDKAKKIGLALLGVGLLNSNALNAQDKKTPKERPPIYVSDSSDVRLKAYQDSMLLYKEGVDHVHEHHPNLGKSPSVIPFEKSNSYDGVTYTSGEQWTKEDLERRENHVETTKQLLANEEYWRDTAWIENVTGKTVDEHRKDVEESLIGKDDHNKMLADAIQKNIYPEGLYADNPAHDPAWKKPVQPIVYKPEQKSTSNKKIR